MKRVHKFFQRRSWQTFSQHRLRWIIFFVTLFLVTTIVPVTAQHSSPFIQNSTFISQISNAATPFEQGRMLYEAGQFSEAAVLWKQAIQQYEAQQDFLNQALSLSYLSLAYQDLGQWQSAERAISQSLELLSNIPQSTPHDQQILAHALNTKGSLQFAIGQAETALDTWKQAEIAYAQARDETGVLGCQINQAQALQTLGLYRRAQSLLEQVNETLQDKPDSLLKASGLRSLGVALQVVGDLQQSREVLEQSLAITQRLGSSQDTSATLFSLGNTVRALQDYEQASKLYQQAAESAITPIAKLQAQLNQLNLLVQVANQRDSSPSTLGEGNLIATRGDEHESEQASAGQSRKGKERSDARALLRQIQFQLSRLPPSREGIYAQVNLAESLMQIGKSETWDQIRNNQERLTNSQYSLEVAQLLAQAIQQARTLKDPKAESYALGELGQLYKQTQQWEEAQNLTQQALQIAQVINASDIAYRWQWQLGQILKQQGKLTDATASYTQAVNTLQSLRSDLVAINPDVQFSFRESVEPVYREFVQLLLQPSPSTICSASLCQGGVSQENLKKAREVIESLQLAELDNFFREACLNAKPEQIDRVDSTAAVIYPIILSDRLAVIVSMPGQPLNYYETNVLQNEVESLLDQTLQSLNRAFSNKERLRLFQQVYDLLIRPAETQLAKSEVKTLVFVLDGSLRNLPMAALYDGQQYLVEKYSIALSPGLQMLEARSLVRERINVLSGGLTEPRKGFSPLPAVESELKQIASIVPAQIFLNQEFIKTLLERQINDTPFTVVHLATHGQFSSKAENTFLLTWDGRINVKDLDKLLRIRETNESNPIELLVLSACQTAAGDKQATLGLAGVAVRSGARSTLATLWSVHDQSTAELMAEFYRQLIQPQVSKAEALRQAQLVLLKQPKYQHPLFWAPFVLIGNWL
ncbi:MAG: CHAT domain-containing protein [Cyanobacteriota bacterium]